MINVIGCDPSYSRTGMALFNSQGEFKQKSISREGGNYKIDEGLTHATEIVQEAKNFLVSEITEPSVLVHEYPVMASRSGAILAILTAKFDSLYRVLLKKGLLTKVVYLPSTAIPAYTGILMKDKTGVVEFAHTLVKEGRYNHDVASAIILAKMGEEVVGGTYKKSKFIID